MPRRDNREQRDQVDDLSRYEVDDVRAESLTLQAEADVRECRTRARCHAYECRAAVLAGDQRLATRHARASQAYSELLEQWIERGESLLRVAEAAAEGGGGAET